MTKHENLTDEQISSLLCRNEAAAAIEVTLAELFHALKEKIPIRKIIAGQHVFIIVFSDDQKTLDFYYSVPSSGTRKASLETQKVIEILKLSQNEAIIGFSWTPHELSFGVFSKYSNDSEGVKGNPSDILFRVDKTGNIVQQSSNMSNVHIYKDGKLNISPTAIETWNETINSINILLEKAYKDDDFQYNVAITNSIVSMIISGFEIYTQRRFVELEGEGLSPNIQKLVDKVISTRKTTEDEKEKLYATSLDKLVEEKINFQSFDKCKQAYNSCYNIVFGNMEKSTELEKLKSFIQCRHQIIHVNPSFSCLNMKELPKKDPILSNKETAILMRDHFINFINKLHNKTMELRV